MCTMKSFLTLASFLLGAQATIYYAGVAESGGEFGVYGTKGQGLPGTFGVDYAFISEAAIDTYVDQNKVCVHWRGGDKTKLMRS